MEKGTAFKVKVDYYGNYDSRFLLHVHVRRPGE